MDIQKYFDDLKQQQINNHEIAKQLFFKGNFIYLQSRKKMVNQLRVYNIPFTYTDEDKKGIHFRLSNTEVACINTDYFIGDEFGRRRLQRHTSNNYHIDDVVIYNSQGEVDFVLHLGLFNTSIELSSLLDYNDKIPKLLAEWKSIEQQVIDLCEKHFKIVLDEVLADTINSSEEEPKRITTRFFEVILKNKTQHWSAERRKPSTVLSDLAMAGLSFNEGKINGISYYFYENGALKLYCYKAPGLIFYIDYKEVSCDFDRSLTKESIHSLSAIVPAIYEQACEYSNKVLKQNKLRNINKSTMENLLEAKMKELKLEYNLIPWDGKHTETYYKSHNPWYNGIYTGIELKIKCKNRRCLTFHVRYEKMEQFLKILDELPKTIETINSLPFNALVSIYGNNVTWKKKK